MRVLIPQLGTSANDVAGKEWPCTAQPIIQFKELVVDEVRYFYWKAMLKQCKETHPESKKPTGGIAS